MFDRRPDLLQPLRIKNITKGSSEPHDLLDIEIDFLRILGVILQLESKYDEARQVHERELMLCARLGDQQREASALGNLGVLHEHIGSFESGVTYLKRSAKLCKAMGNRRGEAAALYNLRRRVPDCSGL